MEFCIQVALKFFQEFFLLLIFTYFQSGDSRQPQLTPRIVNIVTNFKLESVKLILEIRSKEYQDFFQKIDS